MMTSAELLTHLRAWAVRPAVVHRLPGRLRLRIPALTRLENGKRERAIVWRDMLGSLPDIDVTEVNLTTGSVLIRYDPAQLDEADVVGYLNAVQRVVVRHWDRLAATPAERLPRVLKRVIRVVRQATHHRLVLDAATRIPDDVWR
ncbi:MAG TPA: hypothetical protein VMG58_09500 [Candidatus Sulfotelmatobacter sp.]|nr:hypothetical protein [Candidatus Sulfotelmatobacter sp.]